MMDIRKELTDERLCMAVSGRLDTTTAPELDAALKEALPGVKELVLDFTGLDYISSAGLRVLLNAQKKANATGGTMTLTHVNDEIMDVFDMTGFISFLTIE
jgi:anti-sigma B factor antagonist